MAYTLTFHSYTITIGKCYLRTYVDFIFKCSVMELLHGICWKAVRLQSRNAMQWWKLLLYSVTFGSYWRMFEIEFYSGNNFWLLWRKLIERKYDWTDFLIVQILLQYFTMMISAWWLRTSNNFSGQEFEKMHRNFGSPVTPKQLQIPPTTK